MSVALVYTKCGKRDVTVKAVIENGQVVTPQHTGTSKSMRCPDCATVPNGAATLCRNCCPTGHGTTG